MTSKSLDDVAAKQIALALMVPNTKVVSLILRGNQISDEGAMALVAALEKNKTLQELCLQDNKIGPDGAKALAESVKGNTNAPFIKSLYQQDWGSRCWGACRIID